jgi:hypothetical protein
VKIATPIAVKSLKVQLHSFLCKAFSSGSNIPEIPSQPGCDYKGRMQWRGEAEGEVFAANEESSIYHKEFMGLVTNLRR